MMSATLPSSDYVFPVVLPWKDIFKDLTKAGCSPYRVSCLIGMEWSTIQRWVNDGVEPRESMARAILVLHSRYCGETVTKQRLNQASFEAQNLIDSLLAVRVTLKSA